MINKVAIPAAVKKLMGLARTDSWQFRKWLSRLSLGGRANKLIPTRTPLELDKFVRNRADAVYGRFLQRSDNLPFWRQLYTVLARDQIRQRLLNPHRRGNILYLKRLREHLTRRGFKSTPGNKMQWRLPEVMLWQPSQVLKERASTAARGALQDPVIGKYSPYLNRQGTRYLKYDQLFQPQQYSKYPKSKLQQLLLQQGIGAFNKI